MRLLSWNVNGFRAVQKGGFAKWFADQKADVVCLQEIKVTPEQLDPEHLNPGGYHAFWHPAEKLGYSGTATFSRKEPLDVRLGIGDPEIDSEGRLLQTEFPGFVLINGYFPNSQRDHARLPYKLRFLKKLHAHADKLRAAGKHVVICGDFNIAHQEIDLRNPKTNVNNAGFLPEERAWMSSFLNAGYVDVFRKLEPGGGHYTWWSYRPGVREKNVGWRIDYHVVNEELADRVRAAEHQPHVRGSDHCPVALKLRD
jgi:exodeoxyribonuclease-3